MKQRRWAKHPALPAWAGDGFEERPSVCPELQTRNNPVAQYGGRLNECVLLFHAFDPLQSFQPPGQWHWLVHSCVHECWLLLQPPWQKKGTSNLSINHSEALKPCGFFAVRGRLQVVMYNLGSHSYIALLTALIPKVKTVRFLSPSQGFLLPAWHCFQRCTESWTNLASILGQVASSFAVSQHQLWNADTHIWLIYWFVVWVPLAQSFANPSQPAQHNVALIVAEVSRHCCTPDKCLFSLFFLLNLSLFK